MGILEDLQYSHWGYVSDNYNSVMAYGPARMIDREDGTFTAVWKNSIIENFSFNDFDLYTMGILPPEKVKPTFSIMNPKTVSDARGGGQTVITGTKKIVTINDIIRLSGQRVPKSGISKNNLTNNLRVTFLIIQGMS